MVVEGNYNYMSIPNNKQYEQKYYAHSLPSEPEERWQLLKDHFI